MVFVEPDSRCTTTTVAPATGLPSGVVTRPLMAAGGVLRHRRGGGHQGNGDRQGGAWEQGSVGLHGGLQGRKAKEQPPRRPKGRPAATEVSGKVTPIVVAGPWRARDRPAVWRDHSSQIGVSATVCGADAAPGTGRFSPTWNAPGVAAARTRPVSAPASSAWPASICRRAPAVAEGPLRARHPSRVRPEIAELASSSRAKSRLMAPNSMKHKAMPTSVHKGCAISHRISRLSPMLRSPATPANRPRRPA